MSREVLARLLELQGLILDARTALSDGQEEVLALRRTLQDNADLRKLESDMDFQQDGGFYIRKSEVAAGNPVPYCPICWGDSQKAIALSAQADVCYRCILHPTAVYETKVYREEKERNKPKEYVRRFAR